MNEQSPEPPCLIRLRLQVYLPSQVLQTDGRFYHFAPASPCCQKIINSRAPLLTRRYPSSSLVRTPPPPSRLSAHFPLLKVIEPTLLRRFLCGTRRASPVARYVLVTVPSLPPRRSDSVVSIRFRPAMLPSPYGSGLGLRGLSLSGPPVRSLSLWPGDSLTSLKIALSMGFSYLVSLITAIQAIGPLILTLAGLTPAEHTSLNWTHSRA